jgi:hypothetical protein
MSNWESHSKFETSWIYSRSSSTRLANEKRKVNSSNHNWALLRMFGHPFLILNIILNIMFLFLKLLLLNKFKVQKQWLIKNKFIFNTMNYSITTLTRTTQVHVFKPSESCVMVPSRCIKPRLSYSKVLSNKFN